MILFIIAKIIYKITIKGIEDNLKINNKTIARMIVKNFNGFSFLSNFSGFFFREKKCIFDMSKNEKNKAINVSSILSVKITVSCSKVTIGKEAINIATIGVGRPINDVLCLWSILNLDNRIAENIGIDKAINFVLL